MIHLEVALGAELPPVEFSWASSDVQLYNLALGAGTDPTDPGELSYVCDDTPQVLPSFGCVAARFHATEPPNVSFPGIDIALANVLHAGEQVRVLAPLPAAGRGRAITRVADIWDKESAAVIVHETTVTDPAGVPLWVERQSLFARGEGGFGGQRGPSTTVNAPDRRPDYTVRVPTLPQQALLYRLCGDRNPMHSDTDFAALAGFPAPILHGLCTYGMTCKAIADTVLGSRVSRIRSYGARFAGVVFPGETLCVDIWTEDDQIIATVTAPDRQNAPVLSSVQMRIV
ncbi:dehydrogenase [Mycobacterium terramassiliense]|uniref:Dehydrogenase n=2 Tax=Mycobacterium terramassiliense TaxID=1841859 RepID=A0A2U3NGA8_9MYCO|nr:dehydrogenase [Mycobacterium terramassiliense]